jgi:hypothetical protein
MGAAILLALVSLPAGAATITTLFSFDGASHGAQPMGDLTLSADGSTLYGMTACGGVAYTGAYTGYGVIFSLPAGAARRRPFTRLTATTTAQIPKAV